MLESQTLASPAPLDTDDVIIEPRHVPPPSFGLVVGAEYCGNGVIVWSDRPQLVAAPRTAAV